MSKFSFIPVVRGFAGDFSEARLKVAVAWEMGGRWSYRRLGFAFDKEPIELELRQLGTDPVQVAAGIVRLATDKSSDNDINRLSVSLVLADGKERVVAEEAVAELSAFVAARGVWPK